MSITEVRKALRVYPTVISMVGPEDLIREDVTALVIHTFCPDADMRDFNVNYISGQPSKETIVEVCEEPVLSDFRVLFVSCEKPDAYLRHKPMSTVLIATKKPFQVSQLDIDCSRLYGRKLRHWIRSEGKRNGIKLDKMDVDILADSGKGSLRKLRGDIFKLSMLGGMGVEDVKAATSTSMHNTGWDILRHVVKGDKRAAVNVLQRVRSRGVSALQVVAALQREFTNIAMLRIGVELDLLEFELERLEAVSKRLSTRDIDMALDSLLDVESRVKRGDDKLIDIQLVAKLSGMLA